MMHTVVEDKLGVSGDRLRGTSAKCVPWTV